MQLSADQLAQYDRDGFLRFDSLFSAAEIALLKAELTRVGRADSDALIRERTGALRTVYRTHETDGPTASPVFRRLAQTPRRGWLVLEGNAGDDPFFAQSSRGR